MNPELEEHLSEEVKILLKKNLTLSVENNRMLRSLRRAARLHTIMRFVYLFVFVGGLIWSYQFFKPYLDQIRGTYNSYQENQSKVMQVFDKFLPGKSQQ